MTRPKQDADKDGNNNTTTDGRVKESASTTDDQDEAALAAMGLDAVSIIDFSVETLAGRLIRWRHAGPQEGVHLVVVLQLCAEHLGTVPVNHGHFCAPSDCRRRRMYSVGMVDCRSGCPVSRSLECRDCIGLPELGRHVLHAPVPSSGEAHPHRQLDRRYVEAISPVSVARRH